MYPWIEDLKFHFARALRAVGIGLAAVAWASALSSEAQQNADIRTAVQVVAAIVGVCVAQWFSGLPPSATVVDLLQPFERDILAVAREQARATRSGWSFWSSGSRHWQQSKSDAVQRSLSAIGGSGCGRWGV